MGVRCARRPSENRDKCSGRSSRSSQRPSSSTSMDRKRSSYEEKQLSSDSEDEDSSGGPTQPVNILYRYYSEELTRLLIGRSASFDRKSLKGRTDELFNV